jgi:hypothetical protein
MMEVNGGQSRAAIYVSHYSVRPRPIRRTGGDARPIDLILSAASAERS